MGNRANGITIEGLDDVIKMLENIEIDDFKETMLLNECKTLTKEIKDNQKVLTGSQYKGWRGSVRKIEGKKHFVISNDDFSWIFENFGTSKAKHNVGYVDRAISSKIDEVKQSMIEVIERELK
ncbi:HK97-gp10 family putative phage morphogenesis protein [Clostridium tertium]|uniref:HK97-gp10 family putative phage morphogenesis protein n=1 Tax=Clostridium tertium TaxID=1559 RepID=UPI0024B35753|nr:HK97-gp10 family putative phage morphogenesis protein [Clostridium tertium]MDI9215999.1 hypothetical protein [Clostridium tertium]